MDSNQPQLIERAAAVRKAMDFLARRDHSESELRFKLGRQFSTDVIDHAIETMRANRWLPEPTELAQRVAESLHRKQKGYQYICQYLKRKGLPPVSRDLDVEIKKARLVLQSIARGLPSAKKAARLLSRGFDHEVIGCALRDYAIDDDTEWNQNDE